MKRNQKGFTIIELAIVFTLVAIVTSVIFAYFGNNMGWTEDRAKENAAKFVKENSIQVSRTSCAGDSDHDGYGSCTVVTTSGEGINLQCPTDFVQVRIFGASGCKEINGQNKFIIR